MKLIDLMSVIDDNLTVWVSGIDISEVYDGKDSIPEDLNNLIVEYVGIDARGDLVICV